MYLRDARQESLVLVLPPPALCGCEFIVLSFAGPDAHSIVHQVTHDAFQTCPVNVRWRWNLRGRCGRHRRRYSPCSRRCAGFAW